MDMKNMTNKLKIFFLSALLTTPAVRADDVAIFFNVNEIDAGEPLVMFSLDYRPNLTSSICNISDSDSDGVYERSEVVFTSSAQPGCGEGWSAG